ncbi:MAG: hypothetical protein WC842_04090 [Candidatus Paceibacterota bacterium]|jgi:hypothetical protein
MKKRRTKTSERIMLEVDGIMQRLCWVVKNRPEMLLRILCGYLDYKSNRQSLPADAILSEFAKVGLRKKELGEVIQKHPEWNLDEGFFVPI